MNKKQLGYKIYGAIANVFRVFPKNKRKTVFYMVHNDHFQGNLRYMYDAMKKERPEDKYIVVSKSQLFSGGLWKKCKGAFYFYFVLNYHFATAGRIFLNDNFLPLGEMPIKKGTQVVQFWHGVGAWKRFGLTTETDPVTRHAVEKGNQKITHLFVSAKRIVPFYEEAFGVPKERIYPVGLPVLDFYFSDERRAKAREHFFAQYPQLRGKKMLLYTPTFRRTAEENQQLLEQLDAEKLSDMLGEEWAILLRLHPSLQGSALTQREDGSLRSVVEVSAYPDVKELYEVADVLVNDYSSTMVEFALLQKPIVLFAYDLEDYDRGFYADYTACAPGPIVRDLVSLAEEVKREQVDPEKLERFLALHYDKEGMDGNNVSRIRSILEQQ